MGGKASRLYFDPNDECFRKNFAELVEQHGGEWVVIAGGEIVGIGPEEQVSEMSQKAQELHPNDTPLLAPIPTADDVECILLSSASLCI